MMMKKYIGISVACLFIAGTAFGAQKNWGVELSQGFLSDGSTMPEGFTFELGGFAAGFTPSESNFLDWGANFVTTNLEGTTASWVATTVPGFPDHGSADGETVKRPGEPAEGDQAYMWGYNSLDTSGASEWILLTNQDWTFPAGSEGVALPAGEDFRTADAGTMMVFGSAFNHTEEGITAADMVIQTQAIPEPSTYALIFGLGILGFLGFRRFRK